MSEQGLLLELRTRTQQATAAVRSRAQVVAAMKEAADRGLWTYQLPSEFSANVAASLVAYFRDYGFIVEPLANGRVSLSWATQ